MPIELGTGQHVVRLLVGTAALQLFSEWVWVSYRKIPKRVWFLIPWAILSILTFIFQP